MGASGRFAVLDSSSAIATALPGAMNKTVIANEIARREARFRTFMSVEVPPIRSTSVRRNHPEDSSTPASAPAAGLDAVKYPFDVSVSSRLSRNLQRSGSGVRGSGLTAKSGFPCRSGLERVCYHRLAATRLGSLMPAAMEVLYEPLP